MRLRGERIALLVEEDFEDAELLQPLAAMQEAGAEVVVVGSGSRTNYRGKRGGRINADTSAEMVRAEDFDAIIIPGGYAPDHMRLCPAMVQLVREAYNGGKVVAAICHGPQLLISAEIVKGKRLTSWVSVAVDLINAGAQWVDEPVVQDGQIITSRKPADIPQFNAAIIQALEAKKAPAHGRG